MPIRTGKERVLKNMHGVKRESENVLKTAFSWTIREQDKGTGKAFCLPDGGGFLLCSSKDWQNALRSHFLKGLVVPHSQAKEASSDHLGRDLARPGEGLQSGPEQ